MMTRIRRLLGRPEHPQISEFVSTMRNARHQAQSQTRASRKAQREIRERRAHWYEDELLARLDRTEDHGHA